MASRVAVSAMAAAAVLACVPSSAAVAPSRSQASMTTAVGSAPLSPRPDASAAAPAPAAPLAALPATTTQAVVVGSPSPASTTGTLTTWQRDARGAWRPVLGPVTAHLGSDGEGQASESSRHTPVGTFGLTRAFGRDPNPGTALPHFRAGPDDWWVSDTASPAYNTHQTCAPGTCPFDEGRGENLDAAGAAYDDVVVIDVNTAPVVPGRGSAYFLHIGDKPTAGCVATSREAVVAVMRWLTPAARPVIVIGR